MVSSLAELEARALSIERSIDLRPGSTTALGAAIESAEYYMKALQVSETPEDSARLNAKFNELVSKADHLKSCQELSVKRSINVYPVSMRKLTTRENIILLEGSKLNGFVFKPWERSPLPDEFERKKGDGLFTDTSPMPLSQTQLESFGGWKRPKDALALIQITSDGQLLPNEPTVSHYDKVDLVQDLTSDCSVVASLCAGTSRFERGHAKISSSIAYPFDHAAQTMALSPNGKYIFRFYFNGCWRRVEIDDTLPTSTNSRLLHVIDRSRPGLLWPALTEKAYLKVRGGYDFPGSNSGTDLAVLTGWIPQQVFLHDDEIEPDKLWEELVEAFNNGNIFLTIGTGKLSRKEQKQLGLAADHDYAVLEMIESSGVRELLIKNPWADGDVWKGATRRKPNPKAESYPDLPPLDGSDQMLPGTFWMDFNSVFQHYENLYVNWNPGLFKHREDRHFSWNVPQQQPSSTILDTNPQFTIESSEDGEVWLLLNRHFRTGDYTQSTNGKNGFISISLYAKDGHRLLLSGDAKQQGPLVDSPNTLLRFLTLPGKRYTAVIVQQGLPPGKHNFTLSLFSQHPSTLTESPLRYSNTTTLTSAWTRSNSGGNSDSITYLNNPQFQITLLSWQHIAFVLRLSPDSNTSTNHNTNQEIHVKTLLATPSTPSGGRITRLRPRDILAHSGSYRPSTCVLETTLSRGTYTLICSTFDSYQNSKFTLDFHHSCAVYPQARPLPFPAGTPEHLQGKAIALDRETTIGKGDTQAHITPLTSESSGKHIILAPPLTFSQGVTRCLAPLTVPSTTSATFILRQCPSSLLSSSSPRPRQGTSSLFKLSLEQSQGPYKRVLGESTFDDEEFHPIATGLRVENLLLTKEMSHLNGSAAGKNGHGHRHEQGGLWVVVERLAQGLGLGECEEGNLHDGNQDEDEEGDLGVDGHSLTIRKGVPNTLTPTVTSDVNVNEKEVVTVEILVEERVEIGAWGVGDG